MRLAHVVPSYFPARRYGGPIWSVHGLCKALVAAGHRVDVYTTNVDGPKVLPVPVATPVDLDGVHVHYFPVPLARRLYYSPMLAAALESALHSIDVVHLHSIFLYPTLAAARRARCANVPYVVAPRGMLVKGLVTRRSRLAKRAWIAMFERRTLEQADAIHATSVLEAQEIRDWGFRLPEVRVVPNGIEVPQRMAPTARDPRLILFLGRVDWKKGLDRLIPAMAEIAPARLLVAGNDETGYGQHLRKLARQHRVAHRVEFIGPVHEEAKWQLYARAAVFVLPSYSENFGNSVLEAMAMGCPVVVTPEVGLAHVVDTSGAGVVASGKVGALASAIKFVLESPERSRAMSAVGPAVVGERYAWKPVAQAMADVYADMLHRRGVTTIA